MNTKMTDNLQQAIVSFYEMTENDSGGPLADASLTLADLANDICTDEQAIKNDTGPAPFAGWYAEHKLLKNEIATLADMFGWDRPLDHLMNPDFKDDLGKPTIGLLIQGLEYSADTTGCDKGLIVVGYNEYVDLINFAKTLRPASLYGKPVMLNHVNTDG